MRTPGGEPPALELRALDVPFGDAPVPGLRALSLAVAPGERVVVVGPSGAGKTSLLRTIAGLAPAAAGTVIVQGRDVTGDPAERRNAVYLHQSPVLFPHLSVFENVAFPLRVRGVPRPDVRPRVMAMLDAVRLAELANRRPRTLSGGQAHRVALARAVIADPAVLLLDEPLTGLDPALRREVRDAIVAIAARARAAVVMVSHDLEEAALLGDRIAVLSGGGLGQVGTPREVFERPATPAIARFLGVANWLPGRVCEGRVRCALGVVACPLNCRARDTVIVACRAGALRIDAASGVRGTVRAVHYGADQTTATVAVDDTELTVRVDPVDAPDPGACVGVSMDAARVLVYPAESGGADAGG